jgi:hypothetical protein
MQHLWGEKRGADRFWLGKQKERFRVGDLRVGEMIILKWTFKKWDQGNGLD